MIMELPKDSFIALAAVAWADDDFSAEEKAGLLSAAEKAGVAGTELDEIREVMDRKVTILEVETSKTAAGCESDAACLSEIAQALGARFVVYGRLSALGSVSSGIHVLAWNYLVFYYNEDRGSFSSNDPSGSRTQVLYIVKHRGGSSDILQGHETTPETGGWG